MPIPPTTPQLHSALACAETLPTICWASSFLRWLRFSLPHPSSETPRDLGFGFYCSQQTYYIFALICAAAHLLVLLPHLTNSSPLIQEYLHPVLHPCLHSWSISPNRSYMPTTFRVVFTARPPWRGDFVVHFLQLVPLYLTIHYSIVLSTEVEHEEGLFSMSTISVLASPVPLLLGLRYKGNSRC